jgi:CPA2 family monovalent cation:H+ antiporter-2
MQEVHALTPVILLLLTGLLAISLMRPLGLSPIVGYLAAGLVIGPHALNLVPQSETTRLLAELGVVFLLFDIGLHFSLSTIWEARRDILGLGPLQIVLSTAVFAGLGMLSGLTAAHALVLAGALALSSTAVVVQTLHERGQQNCPVGVTATAVLIFQDICAIFLLIFATSMEVTGPVSGVGSLFASVGEALFKAMVAFIGAVLLGYYAVRPLFRLLSRFGKEEVFTATALLVVLATAAASGSAGLSLTLGAFLGGMMISETPYRHVIQTEARPFRDLLLGFFFITVGMSLDWHILLMYWQQILVFLLALIVIKALLVAVSALSFRWSVPGAVQLGFLLSQGSEFLFVIVAMPVVRTTIGEGPAGVVITGVAISLALTPSLAALGNGLARTIRDRLAAKVPPGEITPVASPAPIIIFGLDEVGRCVADALEAAGIGYDAVEMDYDRFLSASADGYPVSFGDLGDVRLMETVAMEARSAVVITIVRYELSNALTPIMRDRYPTLARFVTVDSEAERARFEKIGLRPIVNRSTPRGLDLAAAVLRFQGVDEPRIQAWMRHRQARALETG